eukprot:symbB.v1.2.026353.t1/scaffold2626.1/size122458/3
MVIPENFPNISPIASSYPGFASWRFQTTYRAEFTDGVLPSATTKADSSGRVATAPAEVSRKKDFKAPVPQTLPPGARPRTLGGQLLHTKDPKIIADFKVPKETKRYQVGKRDPGLTDPGLTGILTLQDYPCGRRSPRARYCATVKDWERRPQEMIVREPVVLGKVARINWEARFERLKK